MKRIYTIGRDESCDIVLYDLTNVVSRQHATLRIDGKRCFLTDQSTNGTYRNGIRLIPNVEYPVNKGDEISFGNVASLDWNSIPELQRKGASAWLFILLPAVLLLLAGAAYYYWPQHAETPPPQEGYTAPVVAADTLHTVQPSSEPAKQDSLVVLENVMAKKKQAKKVVKKKENVTNTSLSQKAFENYKDADDDMTQDAL